MLRRKFLPMLAAMAVTAFMMFACAPPAAADNGTKALQATTQAAAVIEATAPAIQQGVTDVKSAQNDPAAVIDATANAVQKVATTIQPIAPPPWSSYIAIVAIIANIIQALFHKQTVTTIAGTPPPSKK